MFQGNYKMFHYQKMMMCLNIYFKTMSFHDVPTDCFPQNAKPTIGLKQKEGKTVVLDVSSSDLQGGSDTLLLLHCKKLFIVYTQGALTILQDVIALSFKLEGLKWIDFIQIANPLFVYLAISLYSICLNKQFYVKAIYRIRHLLKTCLQWTFCALNSFFSLLPVSVIPDLSLLFPLQHLLHNKILLACSREDLTFSTILSMSTQK